MPRLSLRLALALLGVLALLFLAACTPSVTVRVSGAPGKVTVWRPPSPTPTETPARIPAATPTNVPAGWKVLATNHFSLAYPPDWTILTLSWGEYAFETPAQQILVMVRALPKSDVTSYCRLTSPAWQQTTLAGLPMQYTLAPAPTGPNGGGTVGDPSRVWAFANAQQTYYILRAFDFSAGAAAQAQDEAILATFRPDNAAPWQC